MRYTITALLGKQQGASDSFRFKVAMPSLIGELAPLTKPVCAQVKLLKLPHEINVQLKDLVAAFNVFCIRCTKSFESTLTIPFVEREFLIDLHERDIGPSEDVFYVDLENHEIVLDEMIRQEIVLHFPYNPVCSDGCLGLCSHCGVNLNETQCDCRPQQEKSDRIWPFRGLKVL